MNRRRFIQTLTSASVVAAFRSNALSRDLDWAKPQVAITLDDPDIDPTPLQSPEERNRSILAALKKHGDLKAALFVSGRKIDHDAGRKLLQKWNDAGHILGNHTYSHSYYPSKKIAFEWYADDIVRVEDILKSYPQFERSRYMRFPFLKEGDTLEKRDRMRGFLKERGYRMGHVTIDTSEWAIDDRLTKRLAADPKVDLLPYRQFFLDHIWERSQYYDDLAKKVVGRPIKHTVLAHHSLVVSLFLDDLLGMFKRKGWQLIDASDAYTDPVFTRQPEVLPAGESLVWALAKETGKYDTQLRYPGEDEEYEKDKMDKLGL
ncbi:MAG: polysaccharide deacetylase family protein [Acidobacteriota bacterium]